MHALHGPHLLPSPSADALTRAFSAGDVEPGATALLLASRTGQHAVVKMLLQNGADVNAVDTSDDSALLDAATGGWPDLVATLVKAKAAVDHRNASGETALMRGAVHADPAVVQVSDALAWM